MRRDVDEFFRKIRLEPGERLLVGVSGGADSVALLHLLRALASERLFGLHAAHLDHSLRPESAQDAAFVETLCREWGIPLSVKRIDVATESRRRGVGIEEGARAIRRDFLEATAVAQGCRWIVLGHHRGDQAETVLHRFLRGTSTSGLAAMEDRCGPYLRPLLARSRDEILAYLRENGLSWREDASNSDLRFTRNRLRHEILPLLKELNPRLEESLFRLSRRVSVDEDFWRREEARCLAELRRSGPQGVGALSRTGLLQLHRALRSRVVRRAIGEIRGTLEGICAAHLESVESLLQGERPQAEVHLPGVRVRRRYDVLSFDPRPISISRPFSFELSPPGRCTLPDGRLIRAQIFPEALGETPDRVEFDAETVPLPLGIRSFRPGDRFRPSGVGGGKKLKDFFIDLKLDSELRRTLPLVVSGEILWVVGVRRAEGGRPIPGRPVLRLEVEPAPKKDQLTC